MSKITRLTEKQVDAMRAVFEAWRDRKGSLQETVDSMLVNVFYAAIDAGEKDVTY